MEKMFVHAEILESAIVEGLTRNEAETVRSNAGIVSYRCKVYRARLEQGIGSHGSPFVARLLSAGTGAQDSARL